LIFKTKSFGVLSKDGLYYQIIEWADNGSLHEYLQKHKDLGWEWKIKMVYHMAKAIAILHDKLILYRNISR